MAPRDDSTVTRWRSVTLPPARNDSSSRLVMARAGAPPHRTATWGFAVLVILEACAAATGFAVSLIPRNHREASLQARHAQQFINPEASQDPSLSDKSEQRGLESSPSLCLSLSLSLSLSLIVG
jgi:hypothetical protein